MKFEFVEQAKKYLLDKMGTPIDRLGDSTGRLAGLSDL